jgi:hypothetical protein
MNVIGHDGPRLKLIVFAIVRAEDCLDRMGDIGASQPTFSATAIQPSFEFAAAL